MVGLTFPSRLDWDSYIISIAKTTFKKTGTLICSMKFLSPEVTLYLYNYHTAIHGVLLPCLGWYSLLLLIGIVR